MEKINGLGTITPAERVLVNAALTELAASIDKVWRLEHFSFLGYSLSSLGRVLHSSPEAVTNELVGGVVRIEL